MCLEKVSNHFIPSVGSAPASKPAPQVKTQVKWLVKRIKLTEQSQTVKIQRFHPQLLLGNQLFVGNSPKILNIGLTKAKRRLKTMSGVDGLAGRWLFGDGASAAADFSLSSALREAPDTGCCCLANLTLRWSPRERLGRRQSELETLRRRPRSLPSRTR